MAVNMAKHELLDQQCFRHKGQKKITTHVDSTTEKRFKKTFLCLFNLTLLKGHCIDILNSSLRLIHSVLDVQISSQQLISHDESQPRAIVNLGNSQRRKTGISLRGELKMQSAQPVFCSWHHHWKHHMGIQHTGVFVQNFLLNVLSHAVRNKVITLSSTSWLGI